MEEDAIAAIIYHNNNKIYRIFNTQVRLVFIKKHKTHQHIENHQVDSKKIRLKKIKKLI